ncbi:MAG: Omp28-related outer membrane protein [Candidatus Coatesbacteria bacterium]|nr:MAG: Omp28-related outer membrane protein [Candidatus Coatesbacteria bacterium]
MRCSYYGITVTPTAVFDGTVTTQHYNTWPTLFNQRKNVPSPLEIKLKITTAGSNFTVKATLRRQGTMASSGLRFYVALTEQKLSYNSLLYHHVLRKMYPNANGTTFTINNNETKQINVNGQLNSAWNQNNLHVVVWVQNFQTKAVYQARLAKWDEVAVEPVSVGRIKGLFY